MAVETPLKGNIGDSIKRKEDDRFIRGKGNYLDDVVLPGMLHMAINRSPFAHAKIKSINTDAAQAVPGVVAVVVPHFPRRSGQAKGGRLSVVLITLVELVRIAVLVRVDEMRRVGRVET